MSSNKSSFWGKNTIKVTAKREWLWGKRRVNSVFVSRMLTHVVIAPGCVPSALAFVGANCHKNHHESVRWLRWYQPQQSFWLVTAVAGSNRFVTLPSFKLPHKSLKTLGWQFFFLDLLQARQSKKCLDYNPCEEGGVCVYDSTLEKSTCKCRKGLHGTLCEKGQHVCFATFIDGQTCH